jgi:hypothetical protein
VWVKKVFGGKAATGAERAFYRRKIFKNDNRWWLFFLEMGVE